MRDEYRLALGLAEGIWGGDAGKTRRQMGNDCRWHWRGRDLANRSGYGWRCDLLDAMGTPSWSAGWAFQVWKLGWIASTWVGGDEGWCGRGPGS